eukprot:1383359-Rhodomonas_salina.1
MQAAALSVHFVPGTQLIPPCPVLIWCVCCCQVLFIDMVLVRSTTEVLHSAICLRKLCYLPMPTLCPPYAHPAFYLAPQPSATPDHAASGERRHEEAAGGGSGSGSGGGGGADEQWVSPDWPVAV